MATQSPAASGPATSESPNVRLPPDTHNFPLDRGARPPVAGPGRANQRRRADSPWGGGGGRRLRGSGAGRFPGRGCRRRLRDVVRARKGSGKGGQPRRGTERLPAGSDGSPPVAAGEEPQRGAPPPLGDCSWDAGFPGSRAEFPARVKERARRRPTSSFPLSSFPALACALHLEEQLVSRVSSEVCDETENSGWWPRAGVRGMPGLREAPRPVVAGTRHI